VKKSLTFSILSISIGYGILSIAENLFHVICGCAFVGFSFGILFPSFLILITNRCSAKSCVLALSYAHCAQFLGQFLSPYLLQLIKNIFNLSSLRNDFIILAICLTITSAIYIFIKQIMKYRLTH